MQGDPKPNTTSQPQSTPTPQSSPSGNVAPKPRTITSDTAYKGDKNYDRELK